MKLATAATVLFLLQLPFTALAAWERSGHNIHRILKKKLKATKAKAPKALRVPKSKGGKAPKAKAVKGSKKSKKSNSASPFVCDDRCDALEQEFTVDFPRQVYLNLFGSSPTDDPLYSVTGLKDMVGVYSGTSGGNDFQIMVEEIIQGSDSVMGNLMEDPDIQGNSTALEIIDQKNIQAFTFQGTMMGVSGNSIRIVAVAIKPDESQDYHISPLPDFFDLYVVDKYLDLGYAKMSSLRRQMQECGECEYFNVEHQTCIDDATEAFAQKVNKAFEAFLSVVQKAAVMCLLGLIFGAKGYLICFALAVAAAVYDLISATIEAFDQWAEDIAACPPPCLISPECTKAPLTMRW